MKQTLFEPRIKKIILLCLLVIGVTAGIILLLIMHRQKLPLAQYHDAATYIPEHIHICIADSSQKTMCLKNAAQDFTDRYDLPQMLQVFEQNESKKDFFESCHETLHFVGRDEFEKIKNVSAALSAGNPVCFAGYYHGVLEAYLIAKHLTPGEATEQQLQAEIPGLCQKPSSGQTKDYNECLHGLGHSLMFATDSNLPVSLKLCDTLEGDSDQQWCYSGVFMENSTSSTNPDHPNQYLKKDDPMYPCDTLDAKYLTMCYTLQSFYLAQLSNFDWPTTMDWCRKVPSSYRGGCFNAVGQNQVGFTQDYQVMIKNCALVTELEYHISCIQGVVGALHDRYNDGPKKMVEVCNILDISLQPACFERTISIIKSLDSAKPQASMICSEISSATYKEHCVAALGKPSQ
jgi:hypothetical protein